MRMFDDRVLVNPDPPAKTEAGIEVPGDYMTDTRTGVVVAVGPGQLCRNGNRVPVSVKPGDRVMYGYWVGTPFETDDGEQTIMSESELLAVVG